MGARRALTILLLLVAAVFAISFGIARAVRADPSPPAPPPVVVAPAPSLVAPGPAAQLPALRPLPRPSTPPPSTLGGEE